MATPQDKSLDPRVARSRERLQEALLALAVARPLADISIMEIVAEAGVGYATFFRHFADKQALWDAATESMVHEINIRVAPLMTADGHRTAAAEICRHVAAHRDIYRAIFAGGAADNTREVMLRDTLAVAEGARPLETIGLPPTLGSHFAVSALFSILSWWLGEHGDVPPEEIAAYIDRLVFAPMFNGR